MCVCVVVCSVVSVVVLGVLVCVFCVGVRARVRIVLRICRVFLRFHVCVLCTVLLFMFMLCSLLLMCY